MYYLRQMLGYMFSNRSNHLQPLAHLASKNQLRTYKVSVRSVLQENSRRPVDVRSKEQRKAVVLVRVLLYTKIARSERARMVTRKNRLSSMKSNDHMGATPQPCEQQIQLALSATTLFG